MAGVEEELWNIFTFYTLHGNPRDLTTLSVTHFLRLAKDCQIVHSRVAAPGRGSTTNSGHVATGPRLVDRSGHNIGERRLSQAAVNLAFAHVIQRRVLKPSSSPANDCRDRANEPKGRHLRSSAAIADHASTAVNGKLTYPEFMEVLVVMGQRLYGQRDKSRITCTPCVSESNGSAAEGRGGDAGSADFTRRAGNTFQQILMENILPLASRRRQSSVMDAMGDTLVFDILRHFGPALLEIFRFYAVSSTATGKQACISKSDTSNKAATNIVVSGRNSAEHSRSPNDTTSDALNNKHRKIANTHQETALPSDSNARPTPAADDKNVADATPQATPVLFAPHLGAGDTADSTTTHNTPTTAAIVSAASQPDLVPVVDVTTPTRDTGSSTPASMNGSTKTIPGDNYVASSVPPAPPSAIPCCHSLGAFASDSPPSPSSSPSKSGEHENSGAQESAGKVAGSDTDILGEEGVEKRGDTGTRGGLGIGTRAGQRRRRTCDSQGLGGKKTSSEADRKKEMNSMADAISHASLLEFASDFGISGAFVSTLGIGEIFLSCGDAGYGGNASSSGEDDGGDTDAVWTQCAWRTEPAREGTGGVRPLSYLGFQEALVRIALACFGSKRHRDTVISPEVGNGVGVKSGGPGHCLRALLTYIWRRMHISVELALNGVRAGGARHRSSIQKGALLKGVQLFNDRMLSRWRTEGFLDLADATPNPPARLIHMPTPLRVPRPKSDTTATPEGIATTTSRTYRYQYDSVPRQPGSAGELLRRLLAVSGDEVAQSLRLINAAGIAVEDEESDSGVREESGMRGGNAVGHVQSPRRVGGRRVSSLSPCV